MLLSSPISLILAYRLLCLPPPLTPPTPQPRPPEEIFWYLPRDYSMCGGRGEGVIL